MTSSKQLSKLQQIFHGKLDKIDKEKLIKLFKSAGANVTRRNGEEHISDIEYKDVRFSITRSRNNRNRHANTSTIIVPRGAVTMAGKILEDHTQSIS